MFSTGEIMHSCLSANLIQELEASRVFFTRVGNPSQRSCSLVLGKVKTLSDVKT